jgi:hypothetical protein
MIIFDLYLSNHALKYEVEHELSIGSKFASLSDKCAELPFAENALQEDEKCDEED